MLCFASFFDLYISFSLSLTTYIIDHDESSVRDSKYSYDEEMARRVDQAVQKTVVLLHLSIGFVYHWFRLVVSIDETNVFLLVKLEEYRDSPEAW